MVHNKEISCSNQKNDFETKNVNTVADCAEFEKWLREIWFFSVMKRMFWLEELRLMSIMNDIVASVPPSLLDTKIEDILTSVETGNIESQKILSILWDSLIWCRKMFPLNEDLSKKSELYYQ